MPWPEETKNPTSQWMLRVRCQDNNWRVPENQWWLLISKDFKFIRNFIHCHKRLKDVAIPVAEQHVAVDVVPIFMRGTVQREGNSMKKQEVSWPYCGTYGQNTTI
jgi:hypothetical protein